VIYLFVSPLILVQGIPRLSRSSATVAYRMRPSEVKYPAC